MNAQEKIHVVMASDANYAQHLGVGMASLLANTSQASRITVTVINDGISDRDRQLISDLAFQHGCELRMVSFQFPKETCFPVNGYLTRASYLRVFAPELLGPSVEKAIYLDSDLVVKDDIAHLWSTELGDHVIGAVEDWYLNLSDPHKHMIGLTSEMPYFNSGVLLMNLKRWRDVNMTEKLLGFIADHPDKLPCLDQDALNGVLQGHWLPLSLRWNQQPGHFTPPAPGKKLSREFQESIQNPGIIHFLTNSKPWHRTCGHPMKEEYYRYLRNTGWKDYVPPRLPDQKPPRRYPLSPRSLERVVRHWFKRILHVS